MDPILFHGQTVKGAKAEEITEYIGIKRGVPQWSLGGAFRSSLVAYHQYIARYPYADVKMLASRSKCGR